MKQTLRKNIISTILISTGLLVLALGLTKMWQGQWAKMPLPASTENTTIAKEYEVQKTALNRNNLFEKLMKKKSPPSKTSENDLKVLYSKRPDPGETIGSVSFPSLNISLPIYEGTEEKELEKGVGHYSGSVLPGEADNCVLSGHRDTVFSDLKSLKKGDHIVVKTTAGTFTYRVHKFRIVDKEDTTVIVPKPTAYLTLTTCYPFNYIGSAPKRYIISAYLISKS